MSNRRVRMGIDVGGTHTKAVAIDNDTHEIIGKSSVKTTHDDPKGVATGIVQSFQNCLKENNIDPEEVIFVAHSTTQATNALLEGDVAKIGIVALAKKGIEGFIAKIQTNIKNIDLGTGRNIEVISEYISEKDYSAEKISQSIDSLISKGAKVIVSTMAFGVDYNKVEQYVKEVALSKGVDATAASDMTKLYGLTRRTKTAVINGSILPKMINTADSTESSVHNSGVDVPLMIMRGDGGVMDIDEMKKRPVMTMLSGPAASVMGSLMYLRASNGIYFEVGGTSTNIGVIKDGRPAIDYSEVGGHKTFISSLDVHVLGVAGGSMVRANKKGIIDVGPRSAHIAGMDYCVFTSTDKIKNPQIEFFSPKAGDPSDYIAVKIDNGEKITITNSCAANVLGLVKENHFSYGNVDSARIAMQALADYCGTSVEDIAKQILQKSYEKIKVVIEHMIKKYRLDKDQVTLVGVGGGAASLLIYTAEQMNLKYQIPENAEVISSIGVALAMVRDVVERIVPDPQPEDIREIKREAIEKAVESGAQADTVEVHIEIDAQTSKITAIAQGSTEVKTTDLLAECDEKEAYKIAIENFGKKVNNVDLKIQNKYFYIFQGENNSKRPIRILDKKGFVKVQRSNGNIKHLKSNQYQSVVNELWESLAVYLSDSIQRPDFYVCVGPRVMDFAGTSSLEQVLMLMDIELSNISQGEEIIIIGASNEF